MLNNAFSVGLRTLAANPLRTFLSTLGVIIGTAALVAVLAVGDGVEQFARQQIATTTDLQWAAISSQTSRRVDGLSFPRSDTIRIGDRDAAALQSLVGDRADVELRRSGAGVLGGFPDDSVRGSRVVALGAGESRVDATGLRAGRWFTASEAHDGAALAIVSQALAGRLTGSTDHRLALGRRITLQGVALEIVGVTERPNTPEMTTWVPDSTWPRVVLPEMASLPPTLVARGRSIDGMTALVDTMSAWTERRWPGATASGALVIQNRADRVAQAERGMLIFKLLMGSITGISLLVGGIGIMNVLLASVIERTREIGIRRATGAQRRDILGQFLAESLVITGAGSLMGLVLGIAAAFGVAAVMRVRTNAPVHAAFTALPIVVAAASAVIIGLTFGLYPALKASRLSPTEAMRTE